MTLALPVHRLSRMVASLGGLFFVPAKLLGTDLQLYRGHEYRKHSRRILLSVCLSPRNILDHCLLGDTCSLFRVKDQPATVRVHRTAAPVLAAAATAAAYDTIHAYIAYMYLGTGTCTRPALRCAARPRPLAPGQAECFTSALGLGQQRPSWRPAALLQKSHAAAGRRRGRRRRRRPRTPGDGAPAAVEVRCVCVQVCVHRSSSALGFGSSPKLPPVAQLASPQPPEAQ
jgi:hypothetical protein